jgi:hypothetical protein
MEIPNGISKEEIREREYIIKCFYQKWKSENRSLRKFNFDLNDYIYVRNVSNVETANKASKNYLSTLAVLQLDIILTMARVVKYVPTKKNDANQSKFAKMIIMQCKLEGIGIVKLTVGIQARTNENVQYCITAIDTE